MTRTLAATCGSRGMGRLRANSTSVPMSATQRLCLLDRGVGAGRQREDRVARTSPLQPACGSIDSIPSLTQGGRRRSRESVVHTGRHQAVKRESTEAVPAPARACRATRPVDLVYDNAEMINCYIKLARLFVQNRCPRGPCRPDPDREQGQSRAGKPTTKLIEEAADRWAFLVKVLGIKPGPASR